MSNIFSKKQGRPNRVKRNTYDLSFQNNLTTKFGQLTPVFCKEVLPGDTFNIKTAFGLRFMPTAFPLQTRMRADVHFFYVRNRNLWKDWPDFIGQTNPKSSFPVRHIDSISSGDINDYLGVPTTFTGSTASWADVRSTSGFIKSSSHPSFYILNAPPEVYMTSDSKTYPLGLNSWTHHSNSSTIGITVPTSGPEWVVRILFTFASRNLDLEQGGTITLPGVHYFYQGHSAEPATPIRVFGELFEVVDDKSNYGLTLNSVGSFEPNSVSDSSAEIPGYNSHDGYSTVSAVSLCFVLPEASASFPRPGTLYPCFLRNSISMQGHAYAESRDLSEVDPSLNVFNSHNSSSLSLSALPYRAYEAIYNSFYRDDRNNPRLVNGAPEYNDYISTHEGGVDHTNYELFFRNWEQDFLTTAVPSPQQGIAPLVGISSSGVATFSDPESPDKSYKVQLTTADDSDTVTGVSYLENVPGSVQRSLIDVVSSGISINDFRNVNAFQRWLETNIRRGLKYKDQIKSHFDVNVSYQELDMPEFIGGVSEPVQVQQVNQTSAPSSEAPDPLGSYAGQAFAVGSSKHRISHYCDEHGFIIGILSVVPVPNYSQLLPKFFLKHETLDYFFPEFGKIGLQPVRQKEVSPVQSFSSNRLNEVFGYQRPWYDYLSSVDEVHGDFRLPGLRDFVLNRVFRGTPVLGPSFTVIDPNQLNSVFTDRLDTDKILGQVYFECFAKRPIPQYGIPQLEANI